MHRAGRRPGVTETREEILAVAQRLFAARGYDRTTIRGIAAEAGVNPALVHHFFGTKQRVFMAAVDFPFDPTEVLRQIVDGPIDEIGRRTVRVFLAIWSDPTTRAPLLALVRSTVSNEQGADTFRQFMDAALLARLMTALHVPKDRLIAAMAQLVGLALLRHVVRVEPLASAEDEEVVQLVAPVIQRYIAPS